MLFNLKNKKNNSFKIKPAIFAGFTPIPFDPFTVPNYRAGYFMNTTATPPGSINPILVSAQWFDGIVLGIGSKLMQRGNATVLGLVNGFSCENIDITNGALRNPTVDVFNGVTNFTLLIGFNATSGIITSRKIFGVNRAGAGAFPANTHAAIVSGVLGVAMFNDNFTNGCVATSALNNYSNSAWHAAVITADQTNKKITVYTEQETFSGTNPLYTSQVYTPDSQGDFQIASWNLVAGETLAPGFIGDCLIYNRILSATEIGDLLNWEKTRLGI